MQYTHMCNCIQRQIQTIPSHITCDVWAWHGVNFSIMCSILEFKLISSSQPTVNDQRMIKIYGEATPDHREMGNGGRRNRGRTKGLQSLMEKKRGAVLYLCWGSEARAPDGDERRQPQLEGGGHHHQCPPLWQNSVRRQDHMGR